MDSSATLNRRAIWIETSAHGDVFARCVGDVNDPLLLYVHGSGPRNSSLQWNHVVLGIARECVTGGTAVFGGGAAASLPPNASGPYFQVAVDCPGYGRTPGDCQTIRSYHAQFLSDVIRCLGKVRAHCLIGSSQGACAVFNALLDAPWLSQYVAVCHPVGHDVARYARITQPALLLFDEEDDGHPIAVGRRMRTALPLSYW